MNDAKRISFNLFNKLNNNHHTHDDSYKYNKSI